MNEMKMNKRDETCGIPLEIMPRLREEEPNPNPNPVFLDLYYFPGSVLIKKTKL